MCVPGLTVCANFWCVGGSLEFAVGAWWVQCVWGGKYRQGWSDGPAAASGWRALRCDGGGGPPTPAEGTRGPDVWGGRAPAGGQRRRSSPAPATASGGTRQRYSTRTATVVNKHTDGLDRAFRAMAATQLSKPTVYHPDLWSAPQSEPAATVATASQLHVTSHLQFEF